MGDGERRSIAHARSDMAPGGAQAERWELRCGGVVRVQKPLADRSYSANAICTLGDGAEQWAAAPHHTRRRGLF